MLLTIFGCPGKLSDPQPCRRWVWGVLGCIHRPSPTPKGDFFPQAGETPDPRKWLIRYRTRGKSTLFLLFLFNGPNQSDTKWNVYLR